MFDLINEVEAQGILPTKWLREAANNDVIFTERYKIPEGNFQPATLDLRLGEIAHRLRCSFLPDVTSVEEKLVDLEMEEVDLRDGAILERNRPYLVPLLEELRLPEYIQAKTNPRSSTGRLDIFTRVITDHSHKFDEIAPGYQGKLYLEVVSRSFTIKVQTGLSLNQLRLFKGSSRCGTGEILGLHRERPVVLDPSHLLERLGEPGEDNAVHLGSTSWVTRGATRAVSVTGPKRTATCWTSPAATITTPPTIGSRWWRNAPTGSFWSPKNSTC